MPNSQERVKAAINQQIPDRIPRGELCIGDDLIAQHLNSSQVGFEERAAFINDLGLDLICLPPDYPVGKDIPDAAEITVPDLDRWVSETPLFTFALLDGAFGWGTRTVGYTDFLVLSRSSPLSFQALIEKVERMNRELSSHSARGAAFSTEDLPAAFLTPLLDTGASQKEFHDPQPGHRPSHFPVSYPHSAQKNLTFTRPTVFYLSSSFTPLYHLSRCSRTPNAIGVY